jgi:hypothetical protein
LGELKAVSGFGDKVEHKYFDKNKDLVVAHVLKVANEPSHKDYWNQEGLDHDTALRFVDQCLKQEVQRATEEQAGSASDDQAGGVTINLGNILSSFMEVNARNSGTWTVNEVARLSHAVLEGRTLTLTLTLTLSKQSSVGKPAGKKTTLNIRSILLNQVESCMMISMGCPETASISWTVPKMTSLLALIFTCPSPGKLLTRS